MNRAEIGRVGDLLCRRVGFRADPVLDGRLARCVEEAAGHEPIADYVARLDTDRGTFDDLVDRVTIQESQFFRDPAQFDALATYVSAADRPGMIWSAGCANGQEAWSLAMVLAETGRTDWRIVATDISRRALARAAAGQYHERELRQVSAERRKQFFVDREVHARLRPLVSFARHNIASSEMPFPAGSCTTAFCRNVLIYLTDQEIQLFLDRLATGLEPNGVLFLGYSESLWRLRTPFVMRRLGSTFVYEFAGGVRRGASTAPAVPAPVVRPRTPSAPEPEETDRFVADGRAALATGDHRTAIEALRKAVYLRPSDTESQLYLGLAFEAVGDPDAAARCFRQVRHALVSSPDHDELVEGWAAADLLQVLDRKLGPSA